MGWLNKRTISTSSNLSVVEQRAPVAATRAIGWSNVNAPMVDEWDAERAIKIAYLGNAIVFRCVQIIAHDIAKLPLRVGPNPDEPSNYRKDHPLAKLLSKPPLGPNKQLSAHTLIAHAIASYIVTGRFAWEIETTTPASRVSTNNLPEPIAIWPLVTNRLKALTTDSGEDYFREFWYQTGGSEQKRVLQPHQVHYNWRPSQLDIRQPESVIEAANLDISVAIMLDRYDYAFLKNDARPAAIIVHEAFAEKAQQDKFRGQFMMDHQGVENAGRIAWGVAETDEGQKVSESFYIHQLGLTQEQAEFAKKYDQKVRGITAALGVPLSKLDASGRTFDNAEAEDTTYWQDTIAPLLSDIAGAISIDLLPRFRFSDGLAAWFDVTGIDALKPKVKPTTAVIGAPILVSSGIMTVNEARADFGLPASPLPEHDVLRPLEEVFSTPSGSEVDTLIRKLPSVRTIGNGNGNYPSNTSDNHSDSHGNPSYESFLTEQRRIKIIKETDTVVDVLEAKVERDFKRLFAQQEAATISRLQGRRGKVLIDQYPIEIRTAIENIFDETFWRSKTTELSHGLFEDIFIQGGLRIASKVGISFDVKAEYVQQFISNRANRLAGNVTNTTYAAIKNTLSEGVNSGEGISKLAARIKAVFSEATTNRATTIARTETISAFNGSSKLVAKNEASSLIVAQEWIATADDRTRETHMNADGQIVGMEQSFSLDGFPMQYPGDPSGPAEETINCRCTIAYYTADEVGSLSL